MKGESMIVNLSICGFLSLGDSESRLKLEAIESLAQYFRFGGHDFTTKLEAVDVIIGIDSASVSEGRVVLCVQKVGGKSFKFLYNGRYKERAGFITEQTQPNRVLTPASFLATILGD